MIPYYEKLFFGGFIEKKNKNWKIPPRLLEMLFFLFSLKEIQ
jgi:hypothetical protein